MFYIVRLFLVFYRLIIKSQEADSWLFIFIEWKFIQMLWEVLYDNRKLG